MSVHSKPEKGTAERFETLYQSPKVLARRRKAHQMLGLGLGESVLDIGFGPGFYAAELAEAVGRSGHVDGIDTSESMLALAKARCAKLPWVTLQLGDAVQVPYPDLSFSAVLASAVYSYVRDLTQALAELRRVLRPGGRALIIDVDWDTLVWHSTDPVRMKRIISVWQAEYADPHLPRTLAPRLRQAGLQVEQLEANVMLSTEIDPYVEGVTNLMSAAAPGHQGITPEEVAAWEADLEQLASSGVYFFSLNQYLFLVRKPAQS
jgi:ubiquinone/menaquinone biosynthesis C-methylase UbiE